MLKHLLIPLDGSSLAEEALEYAKAIGAPNGKITLVAAVDLPDVLPTGYYPIADPALVATTINDSSRHDGPEHVVAQGREYLENVAARIKADGNFSVDCEVEVAEPADLIIKIATQRKVDAIVMSTHGRSGISRWLFGSVTSRVLSHSPRPVFVIPSKERQARLMQEVEDELVHG